MTLTFEIIKEYEEDIIEHPYCIRSSDCLSIDDIIERLDEYMDLIDE